MRKKIDDKIKTLIENGIILNERIMFVIVGDRGRDQIANLNYLYSKINPGKKLNLLWCYKKELGFSAHAKKKINKIKHQKDKGLYEPNEENAFELFISSTEIKYCTYNESQRILGNTFGMLVLQDFEAITPNLLCRTIETVQGGGMIIFLFNNMTSLKQLYTISMDVHDRYRTDAHKDIDPRFNERFILSLSNTKNCIVMDDELNVLPISQNMSEIVPIEKNLDLTEDNAYITEGEKELNTLKSSFKDKPPMGNLLNECKTLDQAKCVLAMIDSISEKMSKTTVSITAGRGRGKSSAMGLALASALVFGYSNVFVTAPSPDNLKTFFEFVLLGMNKLNYKEHKDYEILKGFEEDTKNLIVKINIFRDHKQTITYIHPNDYVLSQNAEILIIDEAAAIPLHIVKKLMPSCLVFMASTIQGYEGTGRSLSLKLITQLRQQSSLKFENNESKSQSSSGARLLKEVKLSQAIRYADNDPIEDWLNKLLLLDATQAEMISTGYPNPEDLELFYVNRDTLFSFHKASENFLKKLMSLFVSSHYKNSPNDLQLLSDAPSHSIFVLMKPLEKNDSEAKKSIPDIFAAIQVCEEGGISKNVILNNNKRGFKPAGDLIPWTISEFYQDNEFPNLSGIRVVRIATHPECNRMGYGSRALQLLTEFYEGKIINLNEEDIYNEKNKNNESNNNNSTKINNNKLNKGEDKENLIKEEIKPKKKLRPLLSRLQDITPPEVFYIGTAFGLTKELFGFWRKNDFFPFYIKMSENDITGEHSCILIKPIKDDDIKFNMEMNKNFSNECSVGKLKWLTPFYNDFKKRLISLLGFDFRNLPINLALSILEPSLTSSTNNEGDDAINDFDKIKENENNIKLSELEIFINKYDFQRLEKYIKNLVKYQLIIDLVPVVAKFFFDKKFNVKLAYTQAAILLGVGLQYKSFDDISKELNIQINQLLALFNKLMKKFTNQIKMLYEKEIDKEESNKLKYGDLFKEPVEELTKDIRMELKVEAENINNQVKNEKKKYFQEKLNKMENNFLTNKKRNREENN